MDLHISTFESRGREVRVDIYKLRPFAKSIPVKRIEFSEFLRYFTADKENYRWCDCAGRTFCPLHVVHGPDTTKSDPILARHLLQALESDLSYPIWTYEGNVIDGLHRLVKAFLFNESHVLVQEWKNFPPEAIIQDPVTP